MTALNDILRVAAEDVGMRESPPGSNRQPFSARMGRPPEPWCDDWISDVADRAGLGAIIWRSSYVPARLARARELGQANRTPAVGALACFDWSGDGTPDHIALVTGVGTGHVTTIEGNTSPDDHGSQSNGGGVWRRTRAVALVEEFIHPPYEEANVALTPDDIKAVGKAARDAVLAATYGNRNLGEVLEQISLDSAAAAKNSAVLSTGGVDVPALATALIRQLGPGLAAAVADELGKRLDH